MGSPQKIIRFPRRQTIHQKIPKLISELRAALPVLQYIKLLHIAATTGVVPIIEPSTGIVADGGRLIDHIDSSGNKVKILDVSGNVIPEVDRIKLLQYLVDKILPDAKPADTSLPDAADDTNDTLVQAVVEDPSIAPYLSGEELDSLIKEASFYLPAPAHAKQDEDAEPEAEYPQERQTPDDPTDL